MENTSIEISISTKDKKGNVISSKEIRIIQSEGGANPKAESYCEIFTNVLSKQEFTPEEISKALRDFFIETDKKDMSL